MTTEKFLGHINKIHDYQEQKNNKLLEGSSTIPEGSTSQVDNGDGSGTPQDENKNDNLGEDIVTTVEKYTEVQKRTGGEVTFPTEELESEDISCSTRVN